MTAAADAERTINKAGGTVKGQQSRTAPMRNGTEK